MRHLFTPFLVLLLSGCQLTQPGGLFTRAEQPGAQAVASPSRCEWPSTIIVRGGTMAFYGEQAPFWPERFRLCSGQSKNITFYEQRGHVKSADYALTVTVALIDGVLLFDANPYALNVVNHGTRIPLTFDSTQRISNLSLIDTFSISKARNISIIIKQSQRGHDYL